MPSEAATLNFDQAVTDHAVGLFLRYFGAAERLGAAKPAIELTRDREALRLHWAMSPAVLRMVQYVMEHRHEIQSVLENVLRVEDSLVRGRLDAIKTVRLRTLTGQPTLMVSHEPRRSYRSGPNQVLLWVLEQAWACTSRFKAMLPSRSAYLEVVDGSLQQIARSRRLQQIVQISAHASSTQRPSANALNQAKRSRRSVYRLAASAYEQLLKVERGDPAAIAGILRETLLGPLEPWRRFELTVGYSVAEALAYRETSPVHLSLLVGNNRLPIARAGRFAIYWQWATALYSPPPSEPSEAVTQDLWATFGLSSSGDRPDLVIVDELVGAVAAIVEVKYLTGEDPTDRVRSALAQLVRYGRGYSPLSDINPLLARSLVAVSRGASELKSPVEPDEAPLILDFKAILGGDLKTWAKRLTITDEALSEAA